MAKRLKRHLVSTTEPKDQGTSIVQIVAAQVVSMYAVIHDGFVTQQ